MNVTRTRVIYGDAILVVVLIVMYFATAGFTQNIVAMCLVMLLLLGRSIFWHVSWYKATGRIY